MFYEQVVRLCKDRRLAISSLARNLHLSPSAPGGWKDGSLPKAETIMKISEYFGVSTDYLLYGEDRKSNIVGNVSDGAAVLQHSTGNHVAVSSHDGTNLQGFEAELIRIYRTLDTKGKSKLMQAAIEAAFSAEESAEK